MKGNITSEMIEKQWIMRSYQNNIQQHIEDIEEMDTFLETYNL